LGAIGHARSLEYMLNPLEEMTIALATSQTTYSRLVLLRLLFPVIRVYSSLTREHGCCEILMFFGGMTLSSGHTPAFRPYPAPITFVAARAQRHNRTSSRLIAFDIQRGRGRKTQKKENRTATTARMMITTGV
jgi:hypothetical protein